MAAALVYQSDWITGRKQMPTPAGSEVVNVLLSHTMTADEVDALAAADLIVMGEIPEDCVFVDAICADTDLDSGDALDLDFGIVNAGETDWATNGELQNSILVAGTTHVARVTPTVEMLTTASPSTGGTKLGYKVSTAAGTAVAGTIYVSLSYRAAAFGS